MFSDRRSNLSPFQSGRPTRFAPCWLDATLHIEELLLHGSTTQVPVISLRLNSNLVLALPHHPIIIRGCSPESQVSRGKPGLSPYMSGIRGLSLIPLGPVHSYRRHRKTLKLTAIVSPVVKIYFVLSYHFSNLARLALEPLTKRFTLLPTMYLGQMIRYKVMTEQRILFYLVLRL